MPANSTVKKQPDSSFYTIDDVKVILGCKDSKAAEVIRGLNEELTKKGYFVYPQGKVSKKFFNEKFYR